MSLKALVEKIDDVPETARSFYSEKDGKFVLDVEAVEGFSLEDTSGLKSSLGKERQKVRELERITSKFKDLDPDKAREAMEQLEEFRKIDPVKEADKIVAQKLEAAKGQMVEKHSKELQEREGRIGALTQTVQNLLIDQAATSALADAKGSVELLLPHVQRHTRVREVDGKYLVEVIGKDGEPRIGNAKGDPMTIADLVQEMRKSDTFGRAFEGSGQSGSGTRPTNNGGGMSQIKSRKDFKTGKERADWVDANGMAAYNALPMS